VDSVKDDEFDPEEVTEIFRKEFAVRNVMPRMDMTFRVPNDQLEQFRAEIASCETAEQLAMMAADWATRFEIVSSSGVISKEKH
jgi:hypothetical protein